MSILGMRNTANFIANQRPENWRETTLMLYPTGFSNQAPLFALTSLMKSRKVDDPVYHWWEKKFDDRRVVVTADYLIGATTITVSSANGRGAFCCKAGDILYVEQTGEYMRVTADPTVATSLTVSRGWAGSSASAFTVATAGNNPNLLIVGSAFEEGSLAPSGVSHDPTEKSNYTQIFRQTFEATRTAQRTRLRTGDQVKEAKRECLEMLNTDIERALFLGKKSTGTLNSKPVRSFDGIHNFIPVANVFDGLGATGISMDTFEGWFVEMFRYGSSEKLAFGGNLALKALQQIVRKNSNYQIYMGEKEYGISVVRFITPFGTLIFKGHPLFTALPGGITTAVPYYSMDASMTIIDQAQLTYVYIDDVMYQPELAAIGLDGLKSGYLCEIGLEVNFPETHFRVKNLVKGLKDP